MVAVYVEARPKGRHEESAITDYVVEDYVSSASRIDSPFE
jgi:hypothetical protein